MAPGIILPQPLCHRQGLQCAVGYMVVVNDLLAAGNGIRVNPVVLQGTRVCIANFELPVGRHLIIEIGIDTAFHKVVFRGLVWQLNGSDLSGGKEIDLLVGYSIDFVRGFIRNRITRYGVLDGRIISRAPPCPDKYMGVRILVPDLEREGRTDRIGSADFLFQLDFSVHIRCQIKAHMQIGSTGAAFHVEHLHRMSGVVLEDRSAILEETVQIFVHLCVRSTGMLFQISFFIQRPQGRLLSVDIHVPRTEVDAAITGRMNTAQIQNQLPVNIQPEVIVSGELEDQVVPPGIQPAGTLHEVGIHFHTEVMVDIRIQLLGGIVRDGIQLFSVARIQ